jgi:hypothetical protein
MGSIGDHSTGQFSLRVRAEDFGSGPGPAKARCDPRSHGLQHGVFRPAFTQKNSQQEEIA